MTGERSAGRAGRVLSRITGEWSQFPHCGDTRERNRTNVALWRLTVYGRIEWRSAEHDARLREYRRTVPTVRRHCDGQ